MNIVWHNNNAKKWYPSFPNDYPVWPIPKSDTNKYRLGLREIHLIDNKKFTHKRYSELKDGVNIRSTYKMVAIEEVTELLGKGDI